MNIENHVVAAADHPAAAFLITASWVAIAGAAMYLIARARPKILVATDNLIRVLPILAPIGIRAAFALLVLYGVFLSISLAWHQGADLVGQ